MTPKERVLTALACREPDQVPLDYSANPGIDRRLKAHYGLSPDDDEGLRLALGVDFRWVDVDYVGPRLHPEIPGRRVNDQWGIRTRWIEHESGGYWDYCDFPLKEADEETVAAWPMPSPDDYNYKLVPETCDRYREYALFTGGAGLCDIINSTGMLRSMEEVLVDLITDNPAGLLLIDRKIEIHLETTRRTLEAARGKIDFLWMGEDLGTQIAPIISLDLFHKHIRPRHQRFVDLAKSFDLPVMIHTCGSSSWAYEDFIEMGIDAVDTLQPEAVNMSPEYLKKTFGGRLAFHGCISTAGPVATGTPEDVIANVRQTLEIMMPGGGYCCAPTHQLQDNSPTENVIAMYDTAREYGRY
ncbi:MAG TPA: uroporphyrinogen decarboxylase family protein [bacterium]|nr:uroporphyrinogen decarboxylase family protein [bacterium]HQL63507.1 uroporphyrinogen decarboxylase family protein [bacterium]